MTIFQANLRRSIFCACSLFSISYAAAQRSKAVARELPASAYQLVAIKITGSQRYKPEEVAAATGLQIGQTVHEEDFRAAVRVLGDSGAFGDVAFSFDYSAKGTKGEFHVKDSPDFVPARFENIVWFSSRELAEQLHARVPLFDGELPIRGDLAGQVSLALQAMLIEKKVEGRADYERVGTEGGPTEAFDFSVTGRRIAIRDVQFPGADPGLLSSLQAAATELSGQEYSRKAIRAAAEKSFLRFYLQRGYLKASLGEPEARIVKSDEQETTVDVIFRPTPGPQYKLSELAIRGNKVVPSDALRKLVSAHIGEPLNAVQLEADLAELQHLYASRGYMAAVVKASRELDDEAFSVKSTLTVSEGDLYTMGDLDVRGLDSKATAQVQAAWGLRTGDTYSSDYPRKFIDEVERKMPFLGDWTATVHEALNKDKTVDVTLRYDPRN
jgi:outer membrane protein assembly factor BamA